MPVCQGFIRFLTCTIRCVSVKGEFLRLPSLAGRKANQGGPPMRTTYRSATLVAFLALVVTLLSALPAAGQQIHASTQHLRFVHLDVSPRLRNMPLIPPRAEQ